MHRYTSLVLGMLIICSAGFPHVAFAALPAGFEMETIATGMNAPVAMTFVSDGRIFVAEKAGAVRVIKNGALLPTPVIQLSDVNTYGDRGLIGIAADPNFATNGYLYLLYTYENTPGSNFAGTKTGRLVRVTVSGDSADESSKIVILGTVGGTIGIASCQNYATSSDCIPSDSPSHSVGGLRFGPDGKLYVSLGDGAHYDYVDPRAFRAQSLDSLGGKILRINTDGTGLLDNPFAAGTTTTNRSKVFAYGMRNAYRFNFRPSNGALYAGDVGWNTWEEIDKIVAGGNYGWPCREGAGVTQGGYNCDVNPHVDPLYTYVHNVSGAGSVAAGAFPTSYPAAYTSSFFIGDYAQNWIKRVVVDAADNFVSVQDFATGADGTNGPVAVDRGLDGNIYFLAIYTGELKRILYTTGNRQPIAVMAANPTNGLAPLTVNFSAIGSSDPDGNPLTYSWNFGDGSATSSAQTVNHTYAANGTYTAVLTVTDGQGGLNIKNTTVTVGNRSPNAVISSPTTGSLYRIGDTIQLSGSGTDPEDGVITSPANLIWTIILHHNTHTHILQTLTGPNPSFPAPDHSGATDIYTEIQLTVTDSGGLTNTKSINMYVDSSPPPGGNLILNPSFEDAIPSAPGSPQFWAHGGYGVNNSDYLYPVAGHTGAAAAQINVVNYTDGDVKWVHDPVSVVPNTLYSFSGWYKSTAPAELLVENGDGSGAYTYDTLSGAIPTAANWTKLDYTFTTPTNGKTSRVALLLARVGTLTIDDFSIIQGTSTLPVDTTPPLVSITAPAGGSTVTGTTTSVTATATDASGIAEVKFFIDANLLVSDAIAPYSTSWNSTLVSNGTHALVAVARDSVGNVATSTIVNVTVQNQVATSSPNLVPNPSVETSAGGTPATPVNWIADKWGTNTTVFTYPVAGFDGANGVQVQVTAFTNGDAKWHYAHVPVTSGVTYTGSHYYKSTIPTSIIAEYILSNGTFQYVNINLNVPTSAAYQKINYSLTPPVNAVSVSLLHVLAGVGTLTTDFFTLQAPGAPADTTSPSVAITAPVTGTTVFGANVAVTANATDTSGIADVKFLVDSVVVATDTTTPYSFSWNSTNTTNGSHTLMAVARDTAGNIATSSSIAVTVSNSTGTTTVQNLIANPSVETNAGGTPATPLSWQTGKWGTNTATFTYPVAGFDGANAMQLAVTAYTSGDAKWYFNPVAVTPGTTYQYSHYYKSTSVSSVVAQYRLSTGAFTYVTLASTVPANAAWTKLNYTLTPPTNATSVTVFHLLTAVGTLTTDLFSLTPPGTTDTTPPSVAIVSPTAGQVATSSLILSANASDTSGIAGVKFYIDNILRGSEDTTTPYSLDFAFSSSTLADGSHTVLAVARDNVGNMASSSAVTFTAQSTASTTTSVNLISNGTMETANGADPASWIRGGSGNNTRTYSYPVIGQDGGKAVQVQISNYVDGEGEWTPANNVPMQIGKEYTFSTWYKGTTISDIIGEYTLTDGTKHFFGVIKEIPAAANWTFISAKFTPPNVAVSFKPHHLMSTNGTLAIDDVSLTITGNATSTNDITPPIVTITSPAKNATVAGTVAVSATATDNLNVKNVFFAVDGTPVTGLLATPPYTFNWNTLGYSDGVHILKATATDPDGNNAATTTTVIVNNAGTTTTNLITNPSLETTDGTGGPLAWLQGKWGTNTTSFTYPVAGQEGASAAQVTITAYTSGDAKWYFAPKTVTPGATYSYSHFYKSTVPTNVTVWYSMTNGTNLYVDLAALPATANWTQFSQPITVPAGVASMTVFHHISAVGSLTVDNYKLQ